MAGLRLLPFVQQHRRAARDRGERGTADSYLNCSQCYGAAPRAARRLWNCGHERRIPGHRGEYPLPDGADRPDCDTCPGYLIDLPQVIETARAFAWWDKGQLRDFCDGETPPAALRTYLDVLRVAIGEAEAHHLREIREEARRG